MGLEEAVEAGATSPYACAPSAFLRPATVIRPVVDSTVAVVDAWATSFTSLLSTCSITTLNFSFPLDQVSLFHQPLCLHGLLEQNPYLLWNALLNSTLSALSPTLAGIVSPMEKLTISAATAAVKRDGDGEESQPRAPPPAATPLDFPRCEPKYQPDGKALSDDELLQLFAEVIRKGPSLAHLKALNVDLTNNVSLEDLCPEDYLPPVLWGRKPPKGDELSATLGSSPNLSNGGPAPDRNDFYIRARELLTSNQDVHRGLSRTPQLGNRPAVRLNYFHKFWAELDIMAGYWDTSEDKYVSNPDASGPSTTATADAYTSNPDRMEDAPEASTTQGPDKSTATATTNPKPNDNDNDNDNTNTNTSISNKTTSGRPAPPAPTPNPQPKHLYTGRRIDTGRNMPSIYREYALFAFLDCIIPNFRAKVEHAKIPPRLFAYGHYFPLGHMGFVHRVPRDMREARRGKLEGPLMGLSTCGINDTVTFRKSRNNNNGGDGKGAKSPGTASTVGTAGAAGTAGEVVGQGKVEILHLLREIGALLLLAQRRAREGQTEPVPGQGSWWVEKRRWGGCSGIALGYHDEKAESMDVDDNDKGKGNNDEVAAAAAGAAAGDNDSDAESSKVAADQQQQQQQAQAAGSTKKGKRTLSNAWDPTPQQAQAIAKSHRPPTSMWEPNITYKRVGHQHVHHDDSQGEGEGEGEDEHDDVSFLLPFSPFPPTPTIHVMSHPLFSYTKHTHKVSLSLCTLCTLYLYFSITLSFPLSPLHTSHSTLHLLIGKKKRKTFFHPLDPPPPLPYPLVSFFLLSSFP